MFGVNMSCLSQLFVERHSWKQVVKSGFHVQTGVEIGRNDGLQHTLGHLHSIALGDDVDGLGCVGPSFLYFEEVDGGHISCVYRGI